ncbi:MAG: hypothetical protein CUR34_05895 [Sediminibacterium sp.]|nr:MAG: hypothetical protein CUR34_05895 [Sediminibacterium sp.] [Sediminibacterium sp. FEMGT703S]
MEEKQLEILFRQFLLNRGFTNGNLLSQVALRTTGEGVFRPDLVILDIENKEYVALVEFKTTIDERIKVNTLGQFYKYFSLLGTQAIPAFLVFAISSEDFQILFLTKDNTFEPINKDEFPSFETLSAKRLTEEKLKEREIEFKTLKELELKKIKSRQISYLSLISLIIGVIASFITIFYQQNEFKKPSILENNCCDSLQAKYFNLNSKLIELEKKVKLNSISSNHYDTIYSSAKILTLDQRIKIIEKGISEKSLSILQLHNEIEQLKKSDDYIKELTQEKIDNLNDKLNLVNGFMFGLFITIFGAILSYAFTNLKTNKNDNGS